MMFKAFSRDGWDFGEEITRHVPVLQSGRMGPHDRASMLKTAGQCLIRMAEKIEIKKGEVPVHLIAVGATERYGGNRNGDSFPANVCRGYHKTFVKYARLYRGHKNRDPRISYGIVKASAWNDSMHRIELLVALNATKEAAERNGGLVADLELEKLAKDGYFDDSMACMVPYDVCSCCGNKAKTREQYCTKEKCAAGGCKDNLGKIVKVAGDLHHLVVHNPPGLKWMDISNVWRRADRVALAAQADWLNKSAAEGGLTGAQLAEVYHLHVPVERISWTEKEKLAAALADLEELSDVQPQALHNAVVGFSKMSFPEAWKGLSRIQFNKLAQALVKKNVILPLKIWATGQGYQSHEIKAAEEMLPGRMRYATIKDFSFLEEKDFNPLVKEGEVWSVMPSNLGKVAAAVALTEHQSQKNQPDVVYASLEGQKIASDYCAYQLNALDQIGEQVTSDEFLTIARFCAIHNSDKN